MVNQFCNQSRTPATPRGGSGDKGGDNVCICFSEREERGSKLNTEDYPRSAVHSAREHSTAYKVFRGLLEGQQYVLLLTFDLRRNSEV